jgi:hypothetical protein
MLSTIAALVAFATMIGVMYLADTISARRQPKAVSIRKPNAR